MQSKRLFASPHSSNSAAAPQRKQCLAMLTARALQGAANIKPTNVGIRLRLRLRRGRLISARHRLAAFFFTTKNALAGVEKNSRCSLSSLAAGAAKLSFINYHL